MNMLRPYLIRAINSWIVDNGQTPYLLVDAGFEESALPDSFIVNGKIILNIKPEAVQSLVLGNEVIEFNARFGGVETYVHFPVAAAMAIYAKETGKGMVFEEETDGGPTPSFSGSSMSSQKQSKKPTLTVVK